ncbi:MAG: gamma-glutamyltransferase [Gammaproteobacteria bacterium]|tara:strand:- start:674 stop:2365 length:1692 start_codon:yes stop_codon:yes gene_type:complete
MRIFNNLFLALILISIPSQSIASYAQSDISSDGVVVTQHYLATEIGENILAQGGNAYDAAIAVGFALAVVLPRAGNIGGGGFMVIYDEDSNDTYAIDYREKAPAASFRDMYLDENGEFDILKSTFGYNAIGVPGTVHGFWSVHQRFGSLPWADLIHPAIILAERGFVMSDYMAQTLNNYSEKMSYYDETRNIFLRNYPNLKDSRLIQNDLAKTLKRIQKDGLNGFYSGETALLIATDMKENGGLITEQDLLDYRSIWRDPIKGTYRGRTIVTMPPPSSGGIHLIQMLNILENFELGSYEHNSYQYVSLLSETMKYAYADRSEYLGDPDFFEVPISKIIAKEYAKIISASIEELGVLPSSKINPGMYINPESNETTHFSIADRFGNVISNTYTINSAFGSGVTIKGTGILMNNEMDDFSGQPGVPNQFGLLGGIANEIEPAKRPLSSMTPTIVFDNDEPFLAIGSPGGSRIITAVLQIILNVIDFEQSLEEATDSKRVHHQWYPDDIDIEETYNQINELMDLGYKIDIIDTATCTQSIMIDDGEFIGVSDLRRPDSLALGVKND